MPINLIHIKSAYVFLILLGKNLEISVLILIGSDIFLGYFFPPFHNSKRLCPSFLDFVVFRSFLK